MRFEKVELPQRQARVVNWQAKPTTRGIYARLQAFAQQHNITVLEEPRRQYPTIQFAGQRHWLPKLAGIRADGYWQGETRAIVVYRSLPLPRKVDVLLHELAHALHQDAVGNESFKAHLGVSHPMYVEAVAEDVVHLVREAAFDSAEAYRLRTHPDDAGRRLAEQIARQLSAVVRG